MRDLFSSQKMTKFSTSFLLATALVFLAGCSGTTTSASTTTTTTGTGTAATIQLSVSLPQILSTSTSTSVLTAIVLDSTGQVITGKVVTFSVGTDPTAYFTSVSATTDKNGVATATLNIGSDMANRTITVSASADAAVGTRTVKIVGTTIAISGNFSLAFGASSPLTISVKNSAGVAVPGATLTVASLKGNGIALNPATGITDVNGQIVATITVNAAGTGSSDTLTVTGASATQTQTIAITSASFAFTAPVTVAPATTSEIVVNTATPASILWTVAGVAQVGQTVSFFTTRGTITSSAITNGLGVATVSISATSTGSTILTAIGPTGTPAATLNVVFVTNTASTITAQASPSTIGINTSGSLTNQSVISVVVRDAALNLVKNAYVTFSLSTDPSGGSLSAGTAVTDISGAASVNYIAGSNSSAQNGELITATVNSINGVPIAPVTTTIAFTVASQAYYVRLGTDNLVGTTTIAGVAAYTKKYSALVTDTAGNPAPDGTQVRFTLRPTIPPATSFLKGVWVAGSTIWAQTVNVGCPSEDLNLNYYLDPGEDTNGNGFLDPVGVAEVNTTSTTVNGFATATITYNQSYAYWVVMDLEARAGVSGNDPPAVTTLILPGAASDYTNIAIAPPGQVSPFGASNSCADTL